MPKDFPEKNSDEISCNYSQKIPKNIAEAISKNRMLEKARTSPRIPGRHSEKYLWAVPGRLHEGICRKNPRGRKSITKEFKQKLSK